MRILIDADGCPVVDITIKIAKEYSIKCIIICDTAHVFEREGAETITVSSDADSVDFALVNLVQKAMLSLLRIMGLLLCVWRDVPFPSAKTAWSIVIII